MIYMIESLIDIFNDADFFEWVLVDAKDGPNASQKSTKIHFQKKAPMLAGVPMHSSISIEHTNGRGCKNIKYKPNLVAVDIKPQQLNTPGHKRATKIRQPYVVMAIQ